MAFIPKCIIGSKVGPSHVAQLSFWVKPGAKKTQIISIDDEAIHIQVAAPPRDGESNAELTRYLAEILDIRKSQISLDRGFKSRKKLLTICDVQNLQDLYEQLLSKTVGATHES